MDSVLREVWWNILEQFYKGIIGKWSFHGHFPIIYFVKIPFNGHFPINSFVKIPLNGHFHINSFVKLHGKKQWSRAQYDCLYRELSYGQIRFDLWPDRGHSCSVVECLTQDRGATGSSLTGLTVLCPGAKYIYPCLVLVQPKKTRTDITEKLLTRM